MIFNSLQGQKHEQIDLVIGYYASKYQQMRILPFQCSSVIMKIEEEHHSGSRLDGHRNHQAN